MPNWKKVIVSGSDAILNSVTASFTGSLTGAFIGTSSWATSALTASKVLNVRNANDAIFYITAVDSANGTLTEESIFSMPSITANPANSSLTASFFTGSLRGALIGTSSWAISASNATTASTISTQTDNTNAPYFLTFVDANNATPTPETLYTATNVFINPAQRSLSVQGAMTASAGFLGPLTGSVFGTASYVTGSIFTSANPVLSASYALTSSYALNGGVTQIVAGTNVTLSPTNGLGAVTINATGGGPGSSDFPYTGSAIISGSLLVTGSVSAGLGGFTGSLQGTASFSTNTFTNLKTVRLEMGVSSTAVITTGAKGRKTVSFNGTIVGWRLVADQVATIQLDVWKSNLAIPTVSNSICGSAKPLTSAAALNGSTTLTGWTTSVVDGDVFILNVDDNDNATYLCLELDIVLTNA